MARSSFPNDNLLDDLIRGSSAVHGSPTRVTYPADLYASSHISPTLSRDPLANSYIVTNPGVRPIITTTPAPYLHHDPVIVRDNTYNPYTHSDIAHQMRIEDAKRSALPFIQPASTLHPEGRTIHVETVYGAPTVVSNQNQYLLPHELPTHEYIKTHGNQETPNLDCDDPELIKWIINENNHLSGRKNTPYDIHELLNKADHQVRESRNNQIKLSESPRTSGKVATPAETTSPGRLIVNDGRSSNYYGQAYPAPEVEVITHEEWPKKRQEVIRMRDYQYSDDEEDMSNFCGIFVSGKGKGKPAQQSPNGKIIVLK